MAENNGKNPEKSITEKGTEKSAEKSLVALREEQTLAFWKRERIFEKSLEKNSRDGREFIFYDGPPFATGEPHYGHILPGTIKDVIPRYKTMRGFNVRRQWGWDCHGLPIENLIEKELGLKNKKDILDLGIGKFNAAARAAVMRYADEWKRIIPRTGRWVNMDDAYKTMDTSYTESVWWSFKTLYDKGLAYEGFKSMLLCPRCETTLSNFEVNQGYRDITDISVYVKFELIDEKSADGAPTYLLAWTTTPWTLPGNAALAVNPEVDYVIVETAVDKKVEQATGEKSRRLILAKSRLSKVFSLGGWDYKILQEFKGSQLIGKSYKPLFDYYSSDAKLKNRENGWKVYGADFVTTEDGTGIVHIAPAFGADDMELGQRENLPFIQHVTPDGRFKPEVRDFAGQKVKPKDEIDLGADDSTESPPGSEKKLDANAHQKTDVEVIKYLAARNTLFAKEKIVHSYPHCWRCDTPLLNYATSSWFIKVTALKEKLLAANQTVSWLPETIRDGRFGKWLEGAKDWAVSRSRFWGAPLPIWRCDKCARLEAVGSIADLRAKLMPRNTYYVMRHAQAENNVRGIVDSDSHTFHLTEVGKAQAAVAGKALAGKGIDLIITSPFNRTRETGEAVRQALGLKEDQILQDERVHEIGMGIYNGKTIAEYHAHFGSYEERFAKPVPGGETCNDVRKRVGAFLEDVDMRYQGKIILVVTHDTPAWLMFADAAGLDRKGAIASHVDKDFFLQNAEARKLDFVRFPHNEFFETDLHRPGIDEVTYACTSVAGAKCDGTMKRVPEVFDTWYDSGSMPFASRHYPFENLDQFNPKSVPLLKKSVGFPADFIAEGLDQTRGWFYTLSVLSVGLFGKSPFKQVVVNGLILAEDGRKMSKRLKNYPEISYILDRYGADALRYYLMSSPAVHAEDMRFSEKGVDEVYKKLILRLGNVVSFYELYTDGGEMKSASADAKSKEMKSDNVLDVWIVARLNQVIAEVTSALENYELDRAAWPLDGFIDDFSTWYLRRSRDRFKGDDVMDKAKALATTAFVLREFAKVCAPFMPFIAESIYQKVRVKESQGKELQEKNGTIVDLESVHLCEWPAAPKFSQALLTQMTEVRRIVTLGLEARSKAGIKVRQPLAALKVKAAGLSDELVELIKDEVNVKAVSFESALSGAAESAEVELDTTLTPALKEEGIVREFIRAVQDLRKKQNFQPNESASLFVGFDAGSEGAPQKDLKNIIEANQATIAKVAGLKMIEFGSISDEKAQEISIELAVFSVLLTR